MIDMHTHILPGIDDGSRNLDQTMQMIKEAEQAGFKEIITTSHYIENEYDVNSIRRQEMIESLQKKLGESNINVKLHNGAEAFISANLTELIRKQTIPTLANSRYVLFEIPMHLEVLYLDRTIEELITSKYKPIIAHPERYDIVRENPNIAVEWVRKGAMLQSNYGSIVGKYGNKSKQTIIKLLKANAIHFLGTDTHAPKTTYTQIEDIMKKLSKIIEKIKMIELTEENPKKVINNEFIRIEEPENIKRLWGFK